MNITNRQIENEIADLLAEADRKDASAKAMFMEAALLRTQVEHLRQVLALRKPAEHDPESASFVILGFAQGDEREPAALCAFTWTGPANAPADVRILLKSDWTRLVPVEAARYFRDLLNDWTQSVQSQPAMVIAMVMDLSVGPVRTMEHGSMHRNKIVHFVQERLGQVLHFPGVALVK